jgi:hypothetical protein
MGTSTLRQVAPERPAPAVYWRRRFVALIIGLSVLTLVTWALAGALGRSAPPGDPAANRTVHGSLALVSRAPDGRAALLPVSGQPQPSVSPTATATRSATTSLSASAAVSRRPAVRPCPAADVVLSLFSGQASYSGRQTPQFQVDVVSTDSHSCAFDIGAKHVWVQVSEGKTRLWTSAACDEGHASLVTKLHRGVPAVVTISWDAEHSSPGCPVPASPGAAGTYTARASDGSSSSNTFTFSIS